MIRYVFALFSCLTLAAPVLWAQSYGPQIADQSHFPASWVGRWEDTLRIEYPGVRPRFVPMALEIQQRDSLHWDWILIYDVRGQEDRRAYTLEPVQPRQGRWQIDEHNGIVLGARLFGKTLFSLFEVDNQMLLARYSLEGHYIRFEITGAGLEPRPTGGAPDAPPTIEPVPPVNWFEVGVFQQALLYRKQP